jgi:hypothetical protein
MMSDETPDNRVDHLRAQLRQLILMRETGPKRAAWHTARARLIWRLHDEIAREQALEQNQQDSHTTKAPRHQDT